jgi:hypothetical protein
MVVPCEKHSNAELNLRFCGIAPFTVAGEGAGIVLVVVAMEVSVAAMVMAAAAPGWYLKVTHDLILPYHFQFIH